MTELYFRERAGSRPECRKVARLSARKLMLLEYNSGAKKIIANAKLNLMLHVILYKSHIFNI